jgi:hypothetical protein
MSGYATESEFDASPLEPVLFLVRGEKRKEANLVKEGYTHD